MPMPMRMPSPLTRSWVLASWPRADCRPRTPARSPLSAFISPAPAAERAQALSSSHSPPPRLPSFCSLIFSVALAVARRPPSIDGVLACSCRARHEERLKGSRTHKQVARCRTARRPASTSSSPSSCRRSGSSSSSAAGLSSGSASSSPSSATSPASSTPSGPSPSSQPEHTVPFFKAGDLMMGDVVRVTPWRPL